MQVSEANYLWESIYEGNSEIQNQNILYHFTWTTGISGGSWTLITFLLPL